MNMTIEYISYIIKRSCNSIYNTLICRNATSNHYIKSLTMAHQHLNKKTLMNLIEWIIPGHPSHIAMKRKISQYKQLSIFSALSKPSSVIF